MHPKTFFIIVVADITDSKPNVYWELGVRQSFKHGTIIIRELRDNILSVRFFIIFVIVTVLMSSSGMLFIKKYALLQEEYSEGFFNNRQELSGQSGRLRNLINFSQTLMTFPNPLRFMADGDESELPNSVQLSIMNIRNVENIGSGNQRKGFQGY